MEKTYTLKNGMGRGKCTACSAETLKKIMSKELTTLNLWSYLIKCLKCGKEYIEVRPYNVILDFSDNTTIKDTNTFKDEKGKIKCCDCYATTCECGEHSYLKGNTCQNT